MFLVYEKLTTQNITISYAILMRGEKEQ